MVGARGIFPATAVTQHNGPGAGRVTVAGMPTVILVRHGRSTANADGVLAGWSPGVALDDTGRAQATALAARLAALPLAAVVSSPLQRCQETVRPLLDTRPELPLHTDDRIGECHYGDWTGRKLAELADEPLWATVQRHPSAAVFPGGGRVAARHAGPRGRRGPRLERADRGRARRPTRST